MGEYADIKGTTANGFEANSVLFDTTPSIASRIDGRLYYDETWKTLALETGTSTTLQIGQEDWRRVTNNSGKSISDGVPVYIDGVLSGLPTIKRAKADTDATAFLLGLTTETMADDASGMVTIRGNVNAVDTQKIDAAYLEVQGILFHSKIGGTTGNSYTVTIIDTPAAGLHYHEVTNDITIDLGGTTSSSTQVVALFATTPSAIVNVREITATTPIVVMAQTSLANGIETAEGAVLYLSAAIDGALTTVVPEAPGLEVRVGRLMIKNTLPAVDGRINVRIQQAYRLGDLVDVSIVSPAVDNVLKYDGNDWVAGSGVTVSGAMGVEFFMDDTSILEATPTLATNRRKVESLLKTPSAVGQQVESWTTTSVLVFGEAYLYNAAITRAALDAGVWTFDIYCSTNSINSSPQLDQNIYRVIQGVGTLSTARTTTTLQATAASGSPFISADGTDDLSTCSYLQTPKGLFEITVGAVGVDAKKATAICLVAYGANETDIPAGDWKVWRKLFGVNTGNITSVTPVYSLISKQSVQPEIALTADLSDRLGSIMFARSTNTGRIISYVHNGANYASHFQTPLITLHNNLAGLNLGDYQHLTSAQVSALHVRSHALDSTSDHSIGGLTNTYLVKSDGSKLVPATNTDAQVSAAVTASHAAVTVSSPIGMTGQALSHVDTDGNKHVPANSTTNTGKVLTAGAAAGTYTWETPAAGGDITTDTAWVAAGDLIVGTGENTASILTKGTSGKVLTAGDSTLLWDEIPVGYVPITDITYADLATALDEATLVPGAQYLITDFRTVHYIVDGNGNRYDNQEQINIITLEGTDGTAIISLGGNMTDQSIEFATGGTMDLTQTAADFVTDHAAYYVAANIELTSVDEDLILTSMATPTPARIVIEFGEEPENTDQLIVNGKIYTYVTALTESPGVEGEVFIDTGNGNYIGNMAKAINGTGVNGTDYWCAAAHPTCRAVDAGYLIVSAITTGVAGNAYTMAVDSTQFYIQGNFESNATFGDWLPAVDYVGYSHFNNPTITNATLTLSGIIANTQMNGYIVANAVEPLIVTALNDGTISNVARSDLYPQDIIYYDWNPANWMDDISFADVESDPATSIIEGFTGVIYFRHDTLLDNYAPGDWRNCKSRRWFDGEMYYSKPESVSYKDYKLFDENKGHDATYEKQCRSNHFGYLKDDWNTGDMTCTILSNNVIFLADNAYFSTAYNTIGTSGYNLFDGEMYCNTYGDYCHNNLIGGGNYNNTVGQHFAGNTIGGSFDGNIIANDFTFNTIGNSFTYNTIGSGCNNNIFRDGFTMNRVEDVFHHVDFAAATHVYADYNCTLGTDANSGKYLTYIGGSPLALQLVLPTA